MVLGRAGRIRLVVRGLFKHGNKFFGPFVLRDLTDSNCIVCFARLGGLMISAIQGLALSYLGEKVRCVVILSSLTFGTS